MRAILTYHSIDPSGSPISIERGTLERHARWLAASSVQVVALTDLLALPDDTDAVALTFDDGFANFSTDAWPILREHGLPATVFVVSELAGKTNAWEDVPGGGMPVLPLMAWDQLASLHGEGATIGVHARTHTRLVGMDEAQLRDEMCGAKEHIARETGAAAETFAYPFGSFDAASAGAARATFTCACTAELRVLQASDPAHLLPRLDAYYFRSPGRLESWGTARFARYVRLRAAARKVRSAVRGVLGR